MGSRVWVVTAQPAWASREGPCALGPGGTRPRYSGSTCLPFAFTVRRHTFNEESLSLWRLGIGGHSDHSKLRVWGYGRTEGGLRVYPNSGFRAMVVKGVV